MFENLDKIKSVITDIFTQISCKRLRVYTLHNSKKSSNS